MTAPEPIDPAAVLADLGALVSPALTRPGPLRITARDCVFCGPARDCDCASVAFGSPEYFARMARAHGDQVAECALCGRQISRARGAARWTALDTLPAAGCAHVPAGDQ